MHVQHDQRGERRSVLLGEFPANDGDDLVDLVVVDGEILLHLVNAATDRLVNVRRPETLCDGEDSLTGPQLDPLATRRLGVVDERLTDHLQVGGMSCKVNSSLFSSLSHCVSGLDGVYDQLVASHVGTSTLVYRVVFSSNLQRMCHRFRIPSLQEIILYYCYVKFEKARLKLITDMTACSHPLILQETIHIGLVRPRLFNEWLNYEIYSPDIDRKQQGAPST